MSSPSALSGHRATRTRVIDRRIPAKRGFVFWVCWLSGLSNPTRKAFYKYRAWNIRHLSWSTLKSLRKPTSSNLPTGSLASAIVGRATNAPPAYWRSRWVASPRLVATCRDGSDIKKCMSSSCTPWRKALPRKRSSASVEGQYRYGGMAYSPKRGTGPFSGPR